MMKLLSELLPALLGARGFTEVPPEIAEFHLRDVAIEFCSRTHVWRQTLSIDLQAHVSDYPLELEDEAVVEAIDDVTLHGTKLLPISIKDVVYKQFGFRLLENNRLYLPAPNEDIVMGAEVRVICKPSRSACGIADEVFEDWADVITDGAAAKCAGMSKQPWSNAAVMRMYARAYSIGTTRAKNNRTMGGSTAPLMMRGSRF